MPEGSAKRPAYEQLDSRPPKKQPRCTKDDDISTSVLLSVEEEENLASSQTNSSGSEKIPMLFDELLPVSQLVWKLW